MKISLSIILLAICLTHSFAQNTLNISSGTNMKLSGDVDLVLSQTYLDNHGQFNYSGTPTVTFSGGLAIVISGSVAPNFYNLASNMTGLDQLILDSDIVVKNNLELIDGQFDLNGYTVTLDGGQIIGENSSNYVIGGNGGKIELLTNLNAPDQENPGNLGLEITSIANLGATTISRGHEEQTSSAGGKSILRYFDISPTNNSGLNATFRIYYNDAELNGIPEAELEPWRSTDGGDSWELQSGSLLNTTNNWVQLSGVDAFSRWTLASASTGALPVELATFKGYAAAHANILEWQTLSEENVEHFEIQRLRGNDWLEIGVVEAAHFSTVLQSYTFEDKEMKEEAYYRLRVVDFDGKEEFSEVIHIRRTLSAVDLFKVYPNPAHDYLNLEQAENAVADEISLFNANGSFLRSLGQEERIDISDLPAGIYFLEARYGSQFFMKKVVKE